MSKLYLLRHGQSLWNLKNYFTGWVDIPLSKKGLEEAAKAGKVLKDEPIDCIFVSTLIRAQMTAMIAFLEHSSGKVPIFIRDDPRCAEYGGRVDKEGVPVYTAWELNERMYGKLQGLNKEETAQKYGEAQVKLWRRSFDVPPPEGESLDLCAKRTLPYFHANVAPRLKNDQNVLIVAHGNSLRSIIWDLEKLTKDEILNYELATGEPVCFGYEAGIFSRQAL